MKDRWIASVHLVDRPGEVDKYKVKITAENPTRESCAVSYDGPANSLLVAGRVNFKKEVMGLNFSQRVAEALTYQVHDLPSQSYRIIQVTCRIKRQQCF